MRYIVCRGKDECNKAIKAIGQEIINRADDITNDIKDVTSITIYAEIQGGEVANFDIKKNYIAVLEENSN